MVELVLAIEQALQRRPLQPHGVEHRLALGGAGEPVELRQEVAQDADGLVLPVMGQERAGEALQVRDADTSAAQVGADGVHFVQPGSIGLARPSLAPILVHPGRADGQVRVEIGEALDDR